MKHLSCTNLTLKPNRHGAIRIHYNLVVRRITYIRIKFLIYVQSNKFRNFRPPIKHWILRLHQCFCFKVLISFINFVCRYHVYRFRELQFHKMSLVIWQNQRGGQFLNLILLNISWSIVTILNSFENVCVTCQIVCEIVTSELSAWVNKIWYLWDIRLDD